MEGNKYSFSAIGRVIRKHKRGMFGIVLEVPQPVQQILRCDFWVVYGNSCFYCNSIDDIKRVCNDHNWDVNFFDEKAGS